MDRYVVWSVIVFQAEDGIRDLVRSRGLGDVYKRQMLLSKDAIADVVEGLRGVDFYRPAHEIIFDAVLDCLLYTSDAADERSSVDLGGRRILKKKNKFT